MPVAGQLQPQAVLLGGLQRESGRFGEEGLICTCPHLNPGLSSP